MEKILNSIKKRPLNIILMFVSVSLYSVNNLIIKKNTDGLIYIFFVSYFNDLLCPYFFLSYANLLLITSQKEMTKIRILLPVCMAAGCVWEFLAPYMKKGSVTDVGDLVCYFVSTIGYWALLQKVIAKEKDRHGRSKEYL